jgi:hypothetical protein
LAVCVSIVLLLPAVVDRPSYETYLSATQWETDGGFVASGKPNRRTANRRDFTHFAITRRPVLDKLYVAERSGGGATVISPNFNLTAELPLKAIVRGYSGPLSQSLGATAGRES